MLKGGLSEKVTFEQRPEGDEGAGHVDIWRQHIPFQIEGTMIEKTSRLNASRSLVWLEVEGRAEGREGWGQITRVLQAR